MRTDTTPGRAFERADDCISCDADGFRRVAPGYSITQVPGDLDAMHKELVALAGRVTKDEATMADYERAAAIYAQTAHGQAVAADAVFPCPRCKPEQYRRWRNGCYRQGHHRTACEICGPKDRGR